jgi:hypothetical protein
MADGVRVHHSASLWQQDQFQASSLPSQYNIPLADLHWFNDCGYGLLLTYLGLVEHITAQVWSI